jgi:cell division protein FtsI/penicillin-binding protein 2
MASRAGQQQASHWRLAAIAVVLGLCAAGLLARIADLQIANYSAYKGKAFAEHIETDTVPAHRGNILDANGFPLATSVDTYDIAIDRSIWTQSGVAAQDAAALAPLLKRSTDDLYALVGDGATGTTTIARNVDYDTGRKIIALGLPGVVASESAVRTHPEGDLAADVLGFTGQDGTGLSGLEADWNAQLTGQPGRQQFERDAKGDLIPFGTDTDIAPQPGSDLVLTLDRNIQAMAEQELADGLKKNGASGGTIIVMDPRTGAILAMASQPSFKFSTLNLADPSQVALFRNRALDDLYEPGSVFKLFTMSAAIDLGLVNPNTTYMDNCQEVVANRIFHNWDYSCNGPTTMTQVLVRSLNLGSLWLSTKVLGADNFYKYVRAFGMGEETPAGLGGQAAGLVRAPDDPGWSLADLASNSFGQGISASALQMITAVAAVINGGRLMQPYLVKEVRTNGTVQETQPQVRRQVISPQTSATLRDMMRQVLEANPLAVVPGYSAGGKSGTAYVPTLKPTNSSGDAYADEITIPSYTGFAPLDNPRVLIYVKLDDLSSDSLGGQIIAPMFSDLAGKVLRYLDVPPDRPLPSDGQSSGGH